MKLFKVYFKGFTPFLMNAKDELDAAMKCSKTFGVSLNDFCYAVESITKTDSWDNVS